MNDVQEKRTNQSGYRSCLLISSTAYSTWGFTRALHSAGIAVLEREPGPAALSIAFTGEFDVVALVCGGRPSADAIAIRAVAAHNNTRVVALFEDATPDHVSSAFDAGADACLKLDADARVVVAQIEAILRGSAEAAAGQALISVGRLVVDSDRCEIRRDGTTVAVTPTEFRILEHMARNAGRVLQPHEILNAVSEDYEYRPREGSDVFKVYARRIRKKLEVSDEPEYLVNVRGFGYRLEGGSAARAAAAV